jgi:DUF971 family protein
MPRLALYDQVRDRKEYNDREGADPQHVPYVVAGHRRARLGSAFRNSTFFDLRHVLLRARKCSQDQRSAAAAVPFIPAGSANVECVEYLLRERYAVKIFFLGIFTHISARESGNCALNKLMLQSTAGTES